MKSTVKRIWPVGCVLLLTIPAALLIIPFLLDTSKYKPHIERQIVEVLGRPLTVGKQMQLSFFPKPRFRLSDIHVATPPGFAERDMLTAKTLEVRFKLLPFIFSGFNDIQMVRFLISAPQIMLIKKADGQYNWQRGGHPAPFISKSMTESGKHVSQKGNVDRPPRFGPAVKRFSIIDGSFFWIDHQKKRRWGITHLDVNLADLGLDKPIRMVLSARMNGYPLSLKGKIGPLGSVPGEGTVPVYLAVTALKQVKLQVNGQLTGPLEKPGFDFFLKVSEFSVPKLTAAVGQLMPIKLPDKSTLNKVALQARVKGDSQGLDISEGIVNMDESEFNLSVKLNNYARPDVVFNCTANQIDLNHYRPPYVSKKADTQSFERRISPFQPAYHNFLRQLVLKGNLAAGKVKINNTVAQNLKATLVAKNGILHAAPISLQVHGGHLAASASINFRKSQPQSHLRLFTKNVQLGPLLQDIWQKDFLTGTISGQFLLHGVGHNSIQLKKSLSGKGNIRIDNGLIAGIDLLAISRKSAGTSGMPNTATNKPTTPFSKLWVPFSISRGIIYSNKTTMATAKGGITVTGKADMVKERLDIRLAPIMAKSQKEKPQESERWVPVHIFGSFSDPQFIPILDDRSIRDFAEDPK